jgi:hemoglobin-like flavoprotein
MDHKQVELIQNTFAKAAKIAPHLAATFYAELFAIAPTLRPMFKGDVILQGEKLMTMLGQIVSGLDEPEKILPIVQALGRGHVGYGVEASHYALVGTALMRALRHELGAEFTPEARAAWAEAYQFLCDAMCEAAYGPPAARAP